MPRWKCPLAFIPLFATQPTRYLPVMMFSLLLFSLAHADCPDLAATTAQANDALIAARLDDARAALQTAEAAFSCGQAPGREALARYWLVEAAVASVSGQAQDASDAWQAAARLAPELWEPRHGTELRAKRDAAVTAMGSGQGSLEVEALPDGHQLWVDGEPKPSPSPASEGLHVVQLAREEAVFGRIVLLGADEHMRVRAELPAAVEPDPSPDGRSRGAKVAWFAGGGLGLAAGAGLLVVAARQEAPMEEAQRLWELGALTTSDARATVDQRWTRQRAAGGAGYALTALGLAGVGVGVVW